MRRIVKGIHSRLEFDSVADLLATVEKRRDIPFLRRLGRNPAYFGDVDTVDDVFEMARVGWEQHLDDTLSVAERALEGVQRDYELPTWQSYYDVAGSDVDVARYLSGEPENMISYSMVETPRTGRVIALAVNLSISGGVHADDLIRRGKAIVSLVYTLETMGLRTELYTCNPSGSLTQARRTTCDSVRIKGASDTLDPAMIMFALAHPSYFRALMLPAMFEHKEPWVKALDVGSGFGSVLAMPEDNGLPEGTIVLDTKISFYDKITDVEGFVAKHLRDFGLI